MNKILSILIILACHSFASNYCFFDLNGNCVAKANSNQSYHQLKEKFGYKKYYIASAEKTKKQSFYTEARPRKSKGKKRWYEVDWNQGVKLCPEANFNTGNGVWIVNGSAHIDSLNCVYVEGSPYTRSILVLFSRDLNNLTEADSSWLLVNQAIVELAGKSYDVHLNYNIQKKLMFKHDLIVDKTELRIRDAIWLRQDITALKKEGSSLPKTKPLMNRHEKKFYPSSDSLKILDYPTPMDGELISLRSIKDGLNLTSKGIFSLTKIDTSKVFYKMLPYNDMVSILDTTENGYRLPLNIEWIILQSGGTNKFAWGNDNSEEELRRYMKTECAVNDVGVYPVKQYAPNSLGLYDVYGNAEEYALSIHNRKYSSGPLCDSYVDSRHLSDACLFMKKYVCSEYGKNHKSDSSSAFKDGLTGMRLVRKLE